MGGPILNHACIAKINELLSILETQNVAADKDEFVSLFEQNTNKTSSKNNLSPQAVIEKLEAVSRYAKEQKAKLLELLDASEAKSSDALFENKSDNKIRAEAKNSPDAPKKSKKKLSKKTIFIRLEVKKHYLSSLLDLAGQQIQHKIDHNVYRSLVIETCDFFPYLSQKLFNIPSHKEAYLSILNFFWTLCTFPKNSILFPEGQKVLGLPELIPLHYGTEGALFKSTPKSSDNKLSKKSPPKKGAFCFFEDSVHSEAVRIIKKVYNSTTKNLQAIAPSISKDDKFEDAHNLNAKDILKDYKTSINNRIYIYKINFLSFLIWLYLENVKVEPQMLKVREIKSDYFERSAQNEHIRQWEATFLNSL